MSSGDKRKRRFNTRQHSYWYLQENPCVDCGEDDPVVLQYDHLAEFEKCANVSRIITNGSLKQLKEEIKKCEVRCANCHSRKTAKDQEWYKDLL